MNAMKKRKLRIVHAAPYYYPNIGGVEAVVQYISEEMVKRGHSVTVLNPSRIHDGYPSVHLTKNETFNGVSIQRFRTYGTIGHHSIFPGMITTLLRGNYDIFHSHCYRHLHGEILSALGKIKQVPAILHAHGGFYERGGIKGLLCAIYDKLAQYKLLNRFSHYITLTGASKEEMQTIGVTPDRITVIPNAVGNECFDKVSTEDFRERYGLVDKKVLLFLGMLHQLKRPELLVAVLSKIVPALPDAFLLFVGPDAGEFVKVDKLAKELKMEGHMKWVGPLQGTEKQQALEVCEFLILPSDSEPFGIVMLEAMAHGKPVIATATEGARAIIEHNVTGIIAGCGSVDEMADGVLRLLRQPDLSREMGEKARKMVSEKYTIPGVVDQVEALYYKMLSRKKQRGKS